MTDLSPAAQAVLDAAENGLDGYIELLPPTWKSSVSAALRAASWQLTNAKAIDTLRSIADELES